MRRDWPLTLLGLLTFAVGIGMLGWVFQSGLQLYGTPSATLLEVTPGQPLDVNRTGTNLTGLLIRVLLLFLLAVAGSLVANQGVGLMVRGRTMRDKERGTGNEAEG